MDTYSIIKSLHVISMIAWMAGLLYLPRLYVYHCEVEPGSEASEKFKVMGRKSSTKRNPGPLGCNRYQ